jgi:hypothetical protein
MGAYFHKFHPLHSKILMHAFGDILALQLLDFELGISVPGTTSVQVPPEEDDLSS